MGVVAGVDVCEDVIGTGSEVDAVQCVGVGGEQLASSGCAKTGGTVCGHGGQRRRVGGGDGVEVGGRAGNAVPVERAVSSGAAGASLRGASGDFLRVHAVVRAE